ncbi:MAG: hypothetical protein GY820_01960 [Gammaproteobacteria bacterium]|nr:hypothetical protein [Gammaproteobacteria bacterium]
MSADVLRSNRIAALLVVVDILTHYCFVHPVKKKTAKSTTEAFQDVLATSGRKPAILQAQNIFEKFLKKDNEQ